MTRDEFWAIVDRVHGASGGDMPEKCKLLAEELRKLSTEEVASFGDHFRDYNHQAYHEDLWGAAYIICQGCSDDGFMDFRATLISMGRKVFESALENADCLANVDLGSCPRYEGYQYVYGRIYEEKNGPEIQSRLQHPRKPTGTPFDERTMSPRFPKLAAKYGYKDMDPAEVKKQDEAQAKYRSDVDAFLSYMLESGIIPACGLIPPVRVVRELLRRAETARGSGVVSTVPSADFDELIYWTVVKRLEGLTTAELESAKRFSAQKLQLDVAPPPGHDYEAWKDSLKTRGFTV